MCGATTHRQSPHVIYYASQIITCGTQYVIARGVCPSCCSDGPYIILLQKLVLHFFCSPICIHQVFSPFCMIALHYPQLVIQRRFSLKSPRELSIDIHCAPRGSDESLLSSTWANYELLMILCGWHTPFNKSLISFPFTRFWARLAYHCVCVFTRLFWALFDLRDHRSFTAVTNDVCRFGFRRSYGGGPVDQGRQVIFGWDLEWVSRTVQVFTH